MTLTVAMVFWLLVLVCVVVIGALLLFAHGINGLYKLRDEDMSRYWSYIREVSTKVDNLMVRVTSWEQSQDDVETTLEDHGREIEHRITMVGKEVRIMVDKLEQSMIRMVAEGQDYTDQKLLDNGKNSLALQSEIVDVLAAAENKLLQQAHMSVWNDLDGTLTTMRADFDASLNQRTNSITKFVSNSIEGIKENSEAMLKRVSDLEKCLNDADAEAVSSEEDVLDLLERVSKLEREVEEISSDVAGIVIEEACDETIPINGKGWGEEAKPSTKSKLEDYAQGIKEELVKNFGPELIDPKILIGTLAKFLKK